MRLEGSKDPARAVPFALSTGALAVAEPFSARAVPVDATGESARVVVVAFVDFVAPVVAAEVALEPADDVSASETAVGDVASWLLAPAGLAAGVIGATEVTEAAAITGTASAFEGVIIAGAATDTAVGAAAPRVGTFAGAAGAAVGIGGSNEPSAIAACAVGTAAGITGGAGGFVAGAFVRGATTAVAGGAGFTASGCAAEETSS